MRIIETLRAAGHVALLAGGCVRDALLGRTPKDYDVVTDALPARVAELFRRTEQVGAKFGVVLVHLGEAAIEVATFRSDGSYSDGRHPDAVVFGNQVDDAKRRDFTINGMFYDVLEDRVIDHVGGRHDLEGKVVRAIGDPDRRFEEDHLRMLRAVRFAARLGFAIEADTLGAIRRHAHRLPTISTERIREECRLILTHPTRAVGWELMVSTGLADHWLHGVRFSRERSEQIAAHLEALPRRAGFAVVLAVLLGQSSPKAAEALCRGFTCPNAESAAVRWLLAQWPRARDPDGLELADIKLLRADRRFDDLCRLLAAERIATRSPSDAYDTLLARARAIPPAEVAPPPLVNGDDLLARNVPQGPVYARILDAVYRAQLNNEIADRRSALARLESLIGER